MKITSVGPSASLRALEWEEWRYQLVSALVSGGAAAVAAAGVSPAIDAVHFNPGTWDYYKMIVGMFLASGLLKACIYLQTHPLPTVKVTTTTVVSGTSNETPDATVITKIETKGPAVVESKQENK